MSNSDNTVTEVFGKVFVTIIALVVILTVATLFFQVVVFNLGVVGLAAAFGAKVGEIGFATAFGALFVLSVLRGLLSGSPVTVSKDA